MEIDDFLSADTKPEPKPQPEVKPEPQVDMPSVEQWDRIIIPKFTYLVTGETGTGKSALGYWILERYSEKYNLQPVVVGFPETKLNLIPSHYQILSSPEELKQREKVIALIDEAGIQLPLDNIKVREEVSNFLALPRQRHQILLLCYHFPRLVLARYLPFFQAFLLKRPPFLIEFASKSKNDTLAQMMRRAEERFNELVPPNWDPANGQPDAVTSHTYVVSPRLRWQGILSNPKPSFWKDELSEVWSGTGVAEPTDPNQVPIPITQLSTEDRLAKEFGVGSDIVKKAIEMDGLYNLEQLRDMCRKRNLSVSGDKKALATRIILDLRGGDDATTNESGMGS